MKEQADINISISYLDLLMFLDTNELTYNWNFLLTYRLENFMSKGNIIYLRKSIYVSTPMISVPTLNRSKVSTFDWELLQKSFQETGIVNDFFQHNVQRILNKDHRGDQGKGLYLKYLLADLGS